MSERDKRVTENAISNQYPSRSLNKESKEIRLLSLEPSSSLQDTPRCTLEVISLNHAPEFEALSYTWDSLSNQHTIHLDSDEDFYVGRSLYHALQRLRSKTEPRKLWIDALCINQNNDSEKTEQVQLMGAVYRAAHRVLIWLGESALKSESEQRAYDDVVNEYEDGEYGGESLRAQHLALLDLQVAVRSIPNKWWERMWM